MLDQFLEVLYEKNAHDSKRQDMAEAFAYLPEDELRKIASGELKLADFDDSNWVEKFKDTPLYEPALQLEQQCLELDIQEQQQRQAERQQVDQAAQQATWDAKDGIRLKKRMMDLELLKMESSATAGGAIAAGQEAAPPQESAAPEALPKQASLKLGGNRQVLQVLKNHPPADLGAMISSTLKTTKKIPEHILAKHAPTTALAGLSPKIAAIRMAKAAAMHPLEAANHFGYEIDDVAGYGRGGEIHPDMLPVLRERALADMADTSTDLRNHATWAGEHPIRARIPAAAILGTMGGLGGAGLGYALGSKGGGKGALIGGAAGLLAGGALGAHLGSPKRAKELADQLEEAHGVMRDPSSHSVLDNELRRAVYDRHMAGVQEHELNLAQQHGLHGQRARAAAQVFDTVNRGGGKLASMRLQKLALAPGFFSNLVKNPAAVAGAVGAGAGALGGAIAGGPDHRVSGALGGLALGGAVGAGGAAAYKHLGAGAGAGLPKPGAAAPLKRIGDTEALSANIGKVTPPPLPRNARASMPVPGDKVPPTAPILDTPSIANAPAPKQQGWFGRLFSKKSSVTDELLASMRMQKVAAGWFSPIVQGTQTALSTFKSGLSTGLSRAARKGGAQAAQPGVMAGLKNVAHHTAGWAKANPGQAAALGGTAALGTGLGIGAAVS